jgi:hypothetical protein
MSRMEDGTRYSLSLNRDWRTEVTLLSPTLNWSAELAPPPPNSTLQTELALLSLSLSLSLSQSITRLQDATCAAAYQSVD